MSEAAIAILVICILFVLNMVGLGLFIHNTKDEPKDKKWWFEVAWIVLCGVTYIPKGIIEFKK